MGSIGSLITSEATSAFNVVTEIKDTAVAAQKEIKDFKKDTFDSALDGIRGIKSELGVEVDIGIVDKLRDRLESQEMLDSSEDENQTPEDRKLTKE